MPNWCQNHLTVTGATPEFRAWQADHGFSFEKMNPPRKRRKADPKGIAALDCYYTTWGTKWDLSDNEQRQVASELLENGSSFFDTAWSPPIQAIEALSRMFSNVGFQLDYCELGMFFAGTATFHGGGCHDDFHEEEAGVMKIACALFGYEDEEACELVTVE